MTDRYDAIVLGVGGVGSACLYHLARRGVRAVGVERFSVAHDRGSSHGHTRIIRKAYFEAPAYLPLLHRSYDLWRDLDVAVGERLFVTTGLLLAGPPGGATMAGLDRCYAAHDLPHERFDADGLAERFPPLRLAPDASGILDPDAGYLLVERAVAAHCREALRLGATLRVGESVVGWEAGDGGVRVRTDRGELMGDRLVITAGSWAGDALSQLSLPLVVLRKVLLWYTPPEGTARALSSMPCFYVEHGDGAFYGFPAIAPHGLKVAEHTVDLGAAPPEDRVADPLAVDRSLRPGDTRRVEAFLREVIPSLAAPLRREAHAVCLYTCSPDSQFFVDRVPGEARVAFAAGLSGHGFKMASALGEALAELVLDGGSRCDVGFLGIGRLRG